MNYSQPRRAAGFSRGLAWTEGMPRLETRFMAAVFPLILAALGTRAGKRFAASIAASVLHEMAHVTVALLFGLRPDKITITPLGCVASIPGLAGTATSRGAAIILAGPAFNFCLAGLCGIRPGLKDFARANLAVGAINLLPALPLDGGRLACLLLGGATGGRSRTGPAWAEPAAGPRGLPTLDICAKITGGLLLAAGTAQVLLFPPNVSLAALGVFVIFYNRCAYVFQSTSGWVPNDR
ncbi:MAG: hypothetical protein LBS62_14570 [Clostridiales bacterium]|jgi:hypothetical protein|nr:hypothetical protein [Clostridiales bacterium]